ncbi:MAG: ABC transporter substrate-binding protein [Acidimicrobiales bacterium]
MRATPRPTLWRLIAGLLALAMLAAACGDDDGGGDAAPSPDGPTATTAPDEVEPERCPVDALDDADGPVTIDFWHAMTAELETTLEALTDEYNASQDQIRVNLVFQGTYDETAEKLFATARGGDLPTLVQMEETRLQMGIDSRLMLPAESCVTASGYDLSDHLEPVVDQYRVAGQLWPMPFNTSGPVLYYNTVMFEAAGLTADDVPTTLDELREVSQRIVDGGHAPAGFAFELSPWFVEQWYALAGETIVDNDNGRTNRAGATTLDSETGQEIFAFVDGMIDDGLATNIGRNPGGTDALLAIAAGDVAMTFGTSAALGSILAVLGTGQFPDVGVGVAPLPGPVGDQPGGVIVGGAGIWMVEQGQDPVEIAAAWDYLTWLNEPEQQATWHVGTGYMPIRESAVELPAVVQAWEEEPAFRVAYDQLLGSEAEFGGPVIGDYPGMRDALVEALERMILQGADPATALTDAARRADASIDAYNRSVDR